MILACQQQYSLHYIEAAPPTRYCIMQEYFISIIEAIGENPDRPDLTQLCPFYN